MINDYSTLQAAVARWLKRADLAGDIPNFIQLAEGWINRELRVPQMLTLVQGAPDPDGTVALPADYLEAYGVAGSMNGDAAPLDSSQYEIDGSVIRFAPGWGDYELRYYARMPALGDAAPQNWLIQSDPGLYLFAALKETAPFLQDDARVALWSVKAQEIIDGLNTQAAGARFGSGMRQRVSGAV